MGSQSLPGLKGESGDFLFVSRFGPCRLEFVRDGLDEGGPRCLPGVGEILNDGGHFAQVCVGAEVVAANGEGGSGGPELVEEVGGGEDLFAHGRIRDVKGRSRARGWGGARHSWRFCAGRCQ